MTSRFSEMPIDPYPITQEDWPKNRSFACRDKGIFLGDRVVFTAKASVEYVENERVWNWKECEPEEGILIGVRSGRNGRTEYPDGYEDGGPRFVASSGVQYALVATHLHLDAVKVPWQHVRKLEDKERDTAESLGRLILKIAREREGECSRDS